MSMGYTLWKMWTLGFARATRSLIVPVAAAGRPKLDAVFAEMDRLSRGNRLDGLSLRELIEEARR